MKAVDAESFNDLGSILSIGAVVTTGGASSVLAYSSIAPSLMSGYLKEDFGGSVTETGLSLGFESYARSKGIPAGVAGKIANTLTAMGAWKAVVSDWEKNISGDVE